MTNELEWVFIHRIGETVSVSRSACLNSNFENPKWVSLTFCFADVVVCFYSGKKIILSHLLDTLKKSNIYRFRTWNTYFLNSFNTTFSKFSKAHYTLNRLHMKIIVSKWNIRNMWLFTSVNHMWLSDIIGHWNKNYFSQIAPFSLLNLWEVT